jgi:hypothetical protein
MRLQCYYAVERGDVRQENSLPTMPAPRRSLARREAVPIEHLRSDRSDKRASMTGSLGESPAVYVGGFFRYDARVSWKSSRLARLTIALVSLDKPLESKTATTGEANNERHAVHPELSM